MIFKFAAKCCQNWNSRLFSVSSAKMKLNFDPSLKGMKELDRDKFRVELTVPAIKVNKIAFGRFKKILNSYTIESLSKKFHNLDESDPLFLTHKYMILDPDSFDVSKLDSATKEDLIAVLKEDKVRFKLF